MKTVIATIIIFFMLSSATAFSFGEREFRDRVCASREAHDQNICQTMRDRVRNREANRSGSAGTNLWALGLVGSFFLQWR